VHVLAYKNSWRYLINGFPNVSYDEAELMPAKEKMKNILFDGMKKTCHQKKKENSPVENVSASLTR
jgi:hypothetical protein